MPSLTTKSVLIANCPAPLRRYWQRVQASELARRLMHGTFWSLAGALIARGVMFAASIVVARLLGRDGFGQWGVVRATIDMVAAFSGLALAQTATKHLAASHRDDPMRAGRILGLLNALALVGGVGSAATMWVSSSLLADNLLNTPQLAGVLQLAGLLLLFQIVCRMQTGLLAGFEAFKTTARLNLLFGVLVFPAMVLGTLRFGVLGAAGGMLVAHAVQAAVTHHVLRRAAWERGIAVRWRDCLAEKQILWECSLPAALAGIVVAPTHWISRAMLVQSSSGFDEMGSLAAALTMQSLLLFLGTTLNGPLIALLAKSQYAGHHKLEQINVLSSWLFGVLTAVPLLCFPESITALFGASYTDLPSQLTFVLVVFATVVVLFKQGIARSLVAKELQWWGFASNVLWSGVMLTSAWLLVGWGAMGLALASLIAYIATTVCFFPLYIRRRLVPRATLMSPSAAGLWLTMLAALACAVFPLPMLLRGIVCLLLWTGVLACAARLMRGVTSTTVRPESSGVLV